MNRDAWTHLAAPARPLHPSFEHVRAGYRAVLRDKGGTIISYCPHVHATVKRSIMARQNDRALDCAAAELKRLREAERS